MPKSLKLSKTQARVHGVLVGDVSMTVADVSKLTGLSKTEVKSICLILVARQLVERMTIDGQMVFRLR